jgi:RNA polymerase sigma-70 factor, ECF subfamily
MELQSGDTREILIELKKGNEQAATRWFDLVYDHLHRIALHQMQLERPEHTLQPTALVHEAYIRMFQNDATDWSDRQHFYRTAARVMRHILVDHARNRMAAAHGGKFTKLTLDATVAVTADPRNLLLLDGALDRLAEFDARQARVVELRFFGGHSFEEVAGLLDVSPITVKRDWRFARAWLQKELGVKVRSVERAK